MADERDHYTWNQCNMQMVLLLFINTYNTFITSHAIAWAKLLSKLKWEEPSLFFKWLKCEDSTLMSLFVITTLVFPTSKLECHQSTNTAANKFWETLNMEKR